MEDSVTYQATIRRGEIKEARSILIRQGTIRFQAPSADVRERIEAISDLERLHRLLVRVLTAASWDDLLADEAPDGG
jgi:hypothetical protein